MEDREYFEIDKYEELDYYDRLLTQYLITLHSEGLDRQDYKDIYKIVRELDVMRSNAYWNWFNYVRLNKHLLNDEKTRTNIKDEYIRISNSRRYFLDEVENIRGSFRKILELIRKSIKPERIEDYLQEECCLTHLVFTNNRYPKIKLYSNDSFMFSCQYHIEKTPSMGLINSKNYGMCFGCGHSFKCINYLEEMEGLSHNEAISLLSRIYMIDIKNNMIEDSSKLVQKYRSSLLSDEFEALMKRGFERTSKKEKSIDNELALAKFKRDFATINRVRCGEHIIFNGEIEKGKRLILSY